MPRAVPAGSRSVRPLTGLNHMICPWSEVWTISGCGRQKAARLTQSVECQTFNLKVAGSTPALGVASLLEGEGATAPPFFLLLHTLVSIFCMVEHRGIW